MTRENRNLIINALIALLVSVVLVMSYASIKINGNGSKYDDIFGFETKLGALEELNEGRIKSKQNITNKENTIVGSIYTLEGSDIYFGQNEGIVEVELVLKIDKTVIGYEFIKYEHTTDDPFQKNVIEFLNKLVTDKINLSNIKNQDISGTGSTNTKTLLISMFVELNDYLDGTKPEVSFKEKHILEEGKTTTGYSFKLDTKDVSYDVGNGNIVIELELNDNLEIVSYNFVEYTHTAGYRPQVDSWLNLFVSEKVKLSDLTESTDIATGSTRTSTALLKMFIGLADYIENDFVPPVVEKTFKEKHILEEEKTTTGYSFKLDTKDVSYDVGNGNIVIELELNDNLEIVSYNFVEYTHTAGYRPQVDSWLNLFVSEKVKLSDLTESTDIATGSTRTSTALLKMFIGLADYIGGL